MAKGYLFLNRLYPTTTLLLTDGNSAAIASWFSENLNLSPGSFILSTALSGFVKTHDWLLLAVISQPRFRSESLNPVLIKSFIARSSSAYWLMKLSSDDSATCLLSWIYILPFLIV